MNWVAGCAILTIRCPRNFAMGQKLFDDSAARQRKVCNENILHKSHLFLPYALLWNWKLQTGKPLTKR